MNIGTNKLVDISSDEDSEGDLVTDYLSAIIKDDETQEISNSKDYVHSSHHHHNQHHLHQQQLQEQQQSHHYNKLQPHQQFEHKQQEQKQQQLQPEFNKLSTIAVVVATATAAASVARGGEKLIIDNNNQRQQQQQQQLLLIHQQQQKQPTPITNHKTAIIKPISNHHNCINMHNNISMVPTISVTPHSPGSKYNNILEDTLNQLQNIRESVAQLQQSTPRKRHHHHQHYRHNNFISPVNQKSETSRLFSSCPSLPDLTTLNATNNNNIWPNQQCVGFNSDRRKSWTAIEDLTECTKNSHKSVSLSSLDSEEQESLRAAERLHNRNSRNSTGGISTHSLNEAELARDFERLNAKRNLTPQITCRIPLQKSISTPSIAPIRNQNVKEDNVVPTSRHLSDSEDDNQDDRSHLCVRDKNEAYADHPEKRRKRGSLFFRKKKDKSKTKGQSTNCDACGAVINLATYKEHAIECKAKIAKQQSNKSSGKKSSPNSHASSHHHHQHHHHPNDDSGRDYYDGHTHNDHLNFSDDSPLIRNEFLNEPHVTAANLGGEAILGMARENEHDTWSPRVGKEIVKSLNAKQVKRQEHIYELIITEKRHCQILLLMQKVFVESLQRHFSHLNLERLFPRLQDLTELHTGFLKKLRLKQEEHPIVDSVADILLDFFSGPSAQRLKSCYGEFCSNHQTALDTFKCYQNGDHTFAEWHKHKLTNPLLKRKGIPECTLFVVQRLTKYPILIEDQLKMTKEKTIEHDKLQRANALIKEILVDVNARVDEKLNDDRHFDIFKRIDAKSSTFYKKDKFKKSDIIGNGRKLKFEGVATLMQGRSKMQTVIVVVLTDCLFFLQENSNKYNFFTPENKAGVVSLQKLLIREKAGTESRGIYIISSNPAFPEMYELKVQNPKDKNIWIQSIRAAVLNCPSDESESDEYMTAEQKQNMIETKHASFREIIYKMRLKDLEQAILLEEKVALQASYLRELASGGGAASNNGVNSTGGILPQQDGFIEVFLSSFGSYKELVTDDCDTVEITKRVFLTVQEISQLASNLYKSATGYELPMRSFSSVGERQSDLYQSPKLPTRAETFGGFDEKKNKSTLPWRDAVISTINNTISIHNKDNQHHHHDNNKSDTTYSSSETEQITTISVPNNAQQQQHQQLHQQSTTNIMMSKLTQEHQDALQVSHHLHTLLCIINQQMTAIASLHAQVNAIRDNPKTMYRHNDQLEELRNLQDKIQEEKTAWLKQKETQEKELEEQRLEQLAVQRQIRAEQEDIRQQREQLFRKMEKLTSQGVILSPNVPIPGTILGQITNVGGNGHDVVGAGGCGSVGVGGVIGSDDNMSLHSSAGIMFSDEHHHIDGNLTNDRRKDKWRSSSISKTPPGNLLSATNAPKVNQASVKQQLPLKLSSLSSTKSERTPSNSSLTSPSSTTGGVIQMLPLKLADKKNNQVMIPNHTRTGSSPAVIQQLNPTHTGNPATRTNTYPKLPERYRLRSSDGNYYHQQQQQPQHSSGGSGVGGSGGTASGLTQHQQYQQPQPPQRSVSYGSGTTTPTTPLLPPHTTVIPSQHHLHHHHQQQQHLQHHLLQQQQQQQQQQHHYQQQPQQQQQQSLPTQSSNDKNQNQEEIYF